LGKQLVQGQAIDIVLHVGCQIRVVHLDNAADEELANELKKLLPGFLHSDGQRERDIGYGSKDIMEHNAMTN
jgi:hypothetical protein